MTLISTPIPGAKLSALLVLAAVTFAVGCGQQGGDKRVLVTGQVAYDGKPVEIGQIRFIPDATTAGPITITSIENGHYSTESSSGVPVGAHRVEITGFDAAEYANAPRGPGNPPIAQLIPEKFNRQSTLAVTLESTQSSAVKDFDLKP